MTFIQIYNMVAPYLIVLTTGILVWSMVSAYREADRMFEPAGKEKNTEIHK